MDSAGCLSAFLRIFCFLGISIPGWFKFISLRFIFIYGIPGSLERSIPLLVTVSNAFCMQSWQRFMPPGMEIMVPALLSGLRHM